MHNFCFSNAYQYSSKCEHQHLPNRGLLRKGPSLRLVWFLLLHLKSWLFLHSTRPRPMLHSTKTCANQRPSSRWQDASAIRKSPTGLLGFQRQGHHLRLYSDGLPGRMRWSSCCLFCESLFDLAAKMHLSLRQTARQPPCSCSFQPLEQLMVAKRWRLLICLCCGPFCRSSGSLMILLTSHWGRRSASTAWRTFMRSGISVWRRRKPLAWTRMATQMALGFRRGFGNRREELRQPPAVLICLKFWVAVVGGRCSSDCLVCWAIQSMPRLTLAVLNQPEENKIYLLVR